MYHTFFVYHRSCTTPFSVYHRSCTTHFLCTTDRVPRFFHVPPIVYHTFFVYHRSCTTLLRTENCVFSSVNWCFASLFARSAKKFLRVFRCKLMFLVLFSREARRKFWAFSRVNWCFLGIFSREFFKDTVPRVPRFFHCTTKIVYHVYHPFFTVPRVPHFYCVPVGGRLHCTTCTTHLVCVPLALHWSGSHLSEIRCNFFVILDFVTTKLRNWSARIFPIVYKYIPWQKKDLRQLNNF